MRIWTIQPAGLYEILKSRQILLADGRRCYHGTALAYRWMIDQMRRRLPPSQARFPWWGWYRWRGKENAKPDLRSGGHLPKGTKGVRLELDLNPQEVLLSDFADWHFPLNDFFLPFDETESEQFDREEKEAGYDCRGPRPEPLQSRVLTSWERIFDFTRECRDWRGRFRARDIQATFWELRMEHVRDVTFYTDRGR